MEQGSLADLLTLAKSGDTSKMAEMMMASNGGMGGNNQWLWLILIFLFFGGMGGNGFGNRGNANGMNETSQLILEKLSQMSASQCQGDAGLVQLMNANTNNLGSQIQSAKEAAANCCCETNLNICKLGHQIDSGNCQLGNLINGQTNALTNLMTQYQFANQTEFGNIKNQAATNTSAILASIKESEANVIGWLTQEKIANLQGENLILRNQISQNDQTATITRAMRDLICNGCCPTPDVVTALAKANK